MKDVLHIVELSGENFVAEDDYGDRYFCTRITPITKPPREKPQYPYMQMELNLETKDVK